MVKNSEKRNVQISLDKAREWYRQDGDLREIALQAFSEEELKYNHPHSWAEFCYDFPVKEGEHYISLDCEIRSILAGKNRLFHEDRNLCTSKEEAEAFLALKQLRQLRKAWVGDWEPDWKQGNSKWTIVSFDYSLTILAQISTSRALSFPTEEMAQEFLKDFRNLLETAKPLL